MEEMVNLLKFDASEKKDFIPVVCVYYLFILIIKKSWSRLTWIIQQK